MYVAGAALAEWSGLDAYKPEPVQMQKPSARLNSLKKLKEMTGSTSGDSSPESVDETMDMPLDDLDYSGVSMPEDMPTDENMNEYDANDEQLEQHWGKSLYDPEPEMTFLEETKEGTTTTNYYHYHCHHYKIYFNQPLTRQEPAQHQSL